MIRSVPLPPSSGFLVDHNDLLLLQCPRLPLAAARGGSSAILCSSRSDSSIPKLEPFSRSKLDRAIKEPPLIQKTENELADYCSTLEGDPSYSCWRAYFELKDLEAEIPKGELERLIIQAGGVKSLVDYLHGVSAIYKNKEGKLTRTLNREKREETHFHVPDGLPKTAEELEEEEKARMPDSEYTRVLRAIGGFPAWYSPPPDHETD
ncbi:hypothetical protein NMG60_11015347 [Bertholletia excelsa]